MKILVTGGTGFLGSSTVNVLANAGHEVTVFDISLGMDIRNSELCQEAVRGVDAVVHLAGILGTDELFDTPQEAVEINIKGAVNIMQACVDNHARYLGVTMLTVFPSIYTSTKISNEAFAHAYHYNYGLPVTHIRAFNAYGPNQAYGHGHPRKIIPALSVEGWNNVPLKIWGDGNQAVDLVSADDVGKVFLQALSAPGDEEVIDAGTGEGWTVNEVAEFVIEVTNSTAGVEHLPMRRGEKPTQVVSKKEGWEYLTDPPTLDRLDLIKAIVSYRGRELEY